MHKITLIGLIAILACGTAPAAYAAPQYNIVALDVLPGGVDSYATAINESGVVVGHSTLDRTGHVGRSRPVIWNSMGEPTEMWSDQFFGGIPSGINNLGQVVGRYGSGSGIPLPGPGIPPGGAFIWDVVTRNFSDLGDLGGQNVLASGINDVGQVSGSSENSLGQPRAFIWDEVNGMREIGTLGGIWSFGNDINSSGQIAGYSWRADESEHAYIWTPFVGMNDLGPANRDGTRAFGLNDPGDVVGNGTISADLAGALLWEEDRITGLSSSEVAFSFASEVNNVGQAVGYASGNGRAYAVVWDKVLGPRHLEELITPDAGWLLEQATSINDRGQIVGYGLLNDQVRGFLLTPVPEPSSLGILAWALSCGVILTRFHRDARH
jgi:probable HAF family extracellular repeat protein